MDLVNALEQEKIANRAGQLANRLLRLDLGRVPGRGVEAVDKSPAEATATSLA